MDTSHFFLIYVPRGTYSREVITNIAVVSRFTYMVSDKRKFGDKGEEFAVEFLTKNGYKVIDRNYRVKNLGEIDIVSEKNGLIVFFEVKTRDVLHETQYPIESSINHKKRTNLRRICDLYLNEKRFTDREWQVDGLFIMVNRETGKANIHHLENILWEEYY